jgi:hypothetical protein
MTQRSVGTDFQEACKCCETAPAACIVVPCKRIRAGMVGRICRHDTSTEYAVEVVAAVSIFVTRLLGWGDRRMNHDPRLDLTMTDAVVLQHDWSTDRLWRPLLRKLGGSINATPCLIRYGRRSLYVRRNLEFVRQRFSIVART